MSLSKEEILSNIYYDLERGYGSIQSLYKEANKDGAGVSLQFVKDWVKKQPNMQKQGYKNFNSYSAPFSRFEFQIDIMDMQSLMRDTGTKDKLRYALLCIDIFSKKVHVVPLKSKDGVDVYDAVLECFKTLGHPMSIYSDDEGSFNSKKLQDYFKGEGINHIVTLTHANVAERAIRTFKKMIGDRAEFTKNSWSEMLKPVLKKYNNMMVHSSTGFVPNKAHEDDNEVNVKANLVLKEKYLRNYPKIEEGDKVKIYDKGKGNYSSRKETRSKWSSETYTVSGVDRDTTLNKYYTLEGRSKKYNRHELLLVD